MTLRPTPALVAAGLALAALAHAQSSGTISADQVRASMLASDSIQIARVELDVAQKTDSTGTHWSITDTHRVSINLVKRAWIKRFVAAFLPPGGETRDQLCDAPAPLPGGRKPWMVTALWISPEGRGQAYADLENGCGFAGIMGSPPVGVGLSSEQADSLFALFQQGLFADTTLQRMHQRPDNTIAPMPPLPRFGDYPPNPQVEQLPQAIEKVTPTYPDSARAAHIEGTVMVRALVGTDGLVKDAKVMAGEGDPALASAAVACVIRWKFTPAISKGRPVAVWVSVPVKFSLQ